MAHIRYNSATEDDGFVLDDSEAIIGRDAASTIVLDLAPVSRRHARIFVEHGVYCIEDFGSRNGTYVNGERISRPTSLHDGDEIMICGETLRFGDDPTTLEQSLITLDDDLPSAQTIIATVDAARAAAAHGEATNALQAVLSISQTIVRETDLERLLTAILDEIFRLYPGADEAVILMLDASESLVPRASRSRHGEPEGLRVSRTVTMRALDQKQAILSADASSDARLESIHSLHELPIRSLMCVPLLGSDDDPIGVLELHAASKAVDFTTGGLEVLTTVGNMAAIAIENLRLHEDSLRQQRLERDLQTARTVQRSFLPNTPPNADGFEFFVHYEPALTVGGDYYDFLELADGRIAVGIGDVSGKGLPAAMMMARVLVETRAALLQTQDPADALRIVNSMLCASTLESYFVTAVLLVLDTVSGALTYANAGHPPPLMRSADGTVTELGPELAGVPLNVTDDVEMSATTGTTELSPGSSVLLFTDGITETFDADGEQLGLDRVVATFGEHGSARAAGEAVVEASQKFGTGIARRDDTTLVCFGARV